MSFGFIGRKGQSEAPFQLLIAAVMLSMLLPIVFYLFNQYQVWESQERVRNNMETLARELETVANLGEGQKYIDVDLNVYGGADFRVDNFTIYNPGQDVCMLKCHTPHCNVIKPYLLSNITGEPKELIVPKLGMTCIRIPFNVQFDTKSCPKGYKTLPQAENSGVNIAPGVYRFIAIKDGYSVHLCVPKNN